MTHEEAKKRIEKLKKEIDYHRYLYHVLDQQVITDAALDSLKHELYQLEQQFPDLITKDSPTQRVGGEALEKFVKVHHKLPMLSIEDVFSLEEATEWETRIKKLAPNEKFDYYAEIKMDGLAVSVIYKNGYFQVGSTRGDGKIGEDVTQNLKTVESIPLKIRIPSKEDVKEFLKKFNKENNFNQKKLENFLIDPKELEVRGECFMTKKVFDNINKLQEKKGDQKFANPRNAAAGSIRQLDSTITANRHLDFFAYALLTDLGQVTHEQAHELIKLFGFKVNPLNRYCLNLSEVEKFHDYVRKNREKLAYWLDGIVVVINNDKLFDKLGVVGKTPRSMIAYKFPAEQATSQIIEVNWQVGRTGVLTPVATLSPVQVAGTTVTHATLHNLDEINRLGLKNGDTVILEKAGDIIPKIIEVLTRLRTGKEKTIQPPTICPVCGAVVEKKKSATGESVAMYCTNKNCFAKEKEKIIHLVSRQGFDIDGLGEKIVEQLINEGLISTAADLFALEIGDLEPLERFAEKSAQNLIEAIDKAKNVPLHRFIYSLGIIHVGEETAIDLANHFGNIKNIELATLENLENIPNIGTVVAKSIFEWFAAEKNKKLLEEFIKNGVRIIAPEKNKKSSKLKDLSFVFTGEMEKLTRDAAKEKVRSQGGETPSSVSGATSYLVAGADAGSKFDKARKLGVKILTEKEFLEIIKE